VIAGLESPRVAAISGSCLARSDTAPSGSGDDRRTRRSRRVRRAQPAQQTRDYDLRIRDKVQRVCNSIPLSSPAPTPGKLEIASEISAHGNDLDVLRCQSFERRDRRTIPVYGVDAAPAFEAARERSSERTVTLLIGPVACLPREPPW